MTKNDNPLANVAKALPDVPVPQGVGIAAIALQMAMQWHDMGIVKDGSLYQQYKLDGRNIETIGLADVFETAKKIEAHLMESDQRIQEMLINTTLSVIEGVATTEGILKKLADNDMSFINDISCLNYYRMCIEEENDKPEDAAIDTLRFAFENNGIMENEFRSSMDGDDDRANVIIHNVINYFLKQVLSEAENPCVPREVDEDGVPVYRNLDGLKTIKAEYICLIGTISTVTQDSLDIILSDGAVINAAAHPEGSINLESEYLTGRLRRVYVRDMQDHYQYEDIAYLSRTDPQYTMSIEHGIELIMEGKASEVIGEDDEEVFKERRETHGDKRAAWYAFAHVFKKYGIEKEEVSNLTSSRQHDDVSELVLAYLFQKYPT